MKTLISALACSIFTLACGDVGEPIPLDDDTSMAPPAVESVESVERPSQKDAAIEATADASTLDAGEAGPSPGGSCSAASLSCNGTTPLTCENGKWVAGVACADPTSVCDKGLCVACTTGQKSCVGATPRTCTAGQWTYNVECSGEASVCLDGACTQCVPGHKRCTGAVPETCSPGGTWQAKATCEGSAAPTCDPTTAACVECLPGSSSCSGLDSRLCDANKKWVKTQTCQYACGGAGVCGVCQPNNIQCNTPTPGGLGTAETCNVEGQWYKNTSEVEAPSPYSTCSQGCSSPNFTVDDVAKTVFDASTGLTWEREAKYTLPGHINYTDAVNTCASKGWRLPTHAEAYALRALGCYHSFDSTAFPGYWGNGAGVWTSKEGQAGSHVVVLPGPGGAYEDNSLHNVICVK